MDYFSFGGGGGGHRGRRMGSGYVEEESKGGKLPVTRLLRYLMPYRWQAVASVLLSFAIIATHLAPPRIIGWIIDKAIGREQLGFLHLMIALLVLIYLLSAFLEGVKSFVIGRLGQRIVHDLRVDTYTSLQKLNLSYYDNSQTGAMMSRVTNDVNEVERIIVEGTDTLLVAVITLLGIMVILFRMNFKLALIASIPIPLLAFLSYQIVNRAHKIFRQVRKELGDMNALLQDNISGIREIKSFAQEEYEEKRFENKSNNYFLTNIRAIKLRSGFFPLVIFFTSLGTALVLWYGGRLRILSGTGHPTPGEIVSFLFYLNLFYNPVRQLNMFSHMMQHARAACERIFEIMDTDPEIKDSEDSIALPVPIRGEVSFKDVFFSYKKGEVVLKGITFDARPGETIALVGHTGAGKSTIVSLIPRFYEADSGSITIDGIDVKKIRIKNLCGNIGIVAQEPFLFNGTIFENIAYGKRDATLEEVIKVSKDANAHQFISKLPGEYEHEVGERGIKLSVGEKQRLAIARALLKDPPILILDEATSSVDVQTESLIQEALERLISSRTSFIIAHRLSTIRRADRILVVSGGKIAEEGSHDWLLQNGTIYRRLYEIQWKSHSESQG
ncbi:MAG TPA: ABC transporter ATP-binding protein [bacterium]|nr:ABC transporter ATP-binding protein [bacterium]